MGNVGGGKLWRIHKISSWQNKQLATKTLANGHNSLLVGKTLANQANRLITLCTVEDNQLKMNSRNPRKSISAFNRLVHMSTR